MISPRLIAVASYAKGYHTLLDVGTDHGYLPIYALKNNYVNKAIASDINLKPLDNAKKNFQNVNLDVEVILYDGIPETKADVISICGMGGELIIDILEKTISNAFMAKRLILAPNTDAVLVRDYLSRNNYKIVAENIVKDKNHYYEIIVTEKGKANYSLEELYFGPFLKQEKTSIFIEKYEKRLLKLESIIDGITELDKKREINKEIDLIKRLLK